MPDATIDDIREFLHIITRVPKEKIRDDSDLSLDLGIEGDDWDDLLLEFQRKFAVNLDGFVWYFHHGEEGFYPLWLFVPPPNRRVKHIAVTPQVLLASARLGRWAIAYPPHVIPEGRPDLTSWWVLRGVRAVSGALRRIVAK